MELDALADAWRKRIAEEKQRLQSQANEMRTRAQKAAKALIEEFGVKEVWLFGSLAKEPRHEGFDVDLAVSGLPPGRHFAALARACEIVGRPVDLVALETAPPAMVRSIRQRGVRIHGQ